MSITQLLLLLLNTTIAAAAAVLLLQPLDLSIAQNNIR